MTYECDIINFRGIDMATKWVYKFSEGNAEMRNLLGGKGANLAEMTGLNLPIPQVATRSFGSIGVFAIPEMGRFYRHVLIEKNFPHHGAVAFGHFGKTLYEVFKYIGVDVDEIGFNQPKNMLYKTENPFS